MPLGNKFDKSENFWTRFLLALRQEIEKEGKRTKLARGEIVFQTGEAPRGLFFVASGLFGLMTISLSGKESLMRLFKTGQFLGHRSLFSHETYQASAIALEPSEVIFVSRQKVSELTQKYSILGTVIVQTIAGELLHAEKRFISMTEKSVKARVAEALVYLKRVYPFHLWTRKELAEFCGSTTPTVIKILSKFEAQKLIEQRGRKIDILDQDRLLHIALHSSFTPSDASEHDSQRSE